jgi:hypothetical protein
VAELRPLYAPRPRIFQRTVYRREQMPQSMQIAADTSSRHATGHAHVRTTFHKVRHKL